jgi:hypothetical protein
MAQEVISTLMNWPWVSRKAWEVRGELVDVLREQVATQKAQLEQLKQLFDKTSQFEITEQTEETVTLRSKAPVMPSGRAGWRARSAERSDKTVPAPADSVEALQRRVAEAGGKV